MLREVIDLEGKWGQLLVGLGLSYWQWTTIKADCMDARSCLQAVLLVWLSKNYNFKKYGPPSWRTLVKAVADRIGGENVALALKIAEKHPGKIYIYIHFMYCTKYEILSLFQLQLL